MDSKLIQYFPKHTADWEADMEYLMHSNVASTGISMVPTTMLQSWTERVEPNRAEYPSGQPR